MGRINNWIYSLLKNPSVFEGWQGFIVRKDARRILAEQYILANFGDRVLDIGCGPASMLPYLGEVEYTGFDPEPAYIRLARERHGNGGTFLDAGVQNIADQLHEKFEIIIAIGVLHHLDDTQIRTLFRKAASVLKPGGRVITSDPVLRTPQNPLARLVIRLDRGKYVRRREGYTAVAESYFRSVRSELRSDFMRIPYDHCILVCESPVDAT